MHELSEFVLGLVEGLPSGAGGPEYGIAIAVTEVEFALPVEVRFTVERAIELSSPRTRLHTGFAAECGRLTLRVVSDSAAAPADGDGEEVGDDRA